MADKPIFDFVKNLELGSKTLQMYSETHPRTQKAVQDTYQSILGLLENRDSLTVSVSHGNLLIDGELVEKGNLILDRFLRELTDRNIHSLMIYRGVKVEDLVALLRRLILKPQRVRELGGFDKILSDDGVQTIQVNKVKYGIIEEGALPDAIDQSLVTELLLAVQALFSGTSKASEVARNVEKTLELNKGLDTGGTLLRLFQTIIVRASDVSQEELLKHKFVELYRSFTGGTQGKLLLSSLLHDSPDKDMVMFYRLLPPEYFESSLLQLLDEPIPLNQLGEVVNRIQKDPEIVLSERVIRKMKEKGLLQPEAHSAPASIADAILKKASLNNSDIERIPDALHELINKGQLQEADQLSKRLFNCLGTGQPEQKKAAIEFLPSAIRALSTNDKWKNVDHSLSFLISTCCRKETSVDVLQAYIPLLLSMFMKNYEAANWPSCQDVLSTIRLQTERHDSIKQAFADAWIRIAEAFIERLRDGLSGIEVIVEGFKMAGSKGASYLIEMLADEEDQKVRSRLISSIVSFRSDIVSAELQRRMTDPRWFVVRNMVTIAGKAQSAELPEFLEAAALHPDPRVPKELMKILYKGTGKSELRFILLLMEHPDKNVKIQAVHLVTMQANSGAVPSLVKLLESVTVAETDLRTACLQALLKLRSTDGIVSAATLLDRKPSSRGEIAERNAAVRLLGELAREQTRSILEKTAQTDPNPETRALAASYL